MGVCLAISSSVCLFSSFHLLKIDLQTVLLVGPISSLTGGKLLIRAARASGRANRPGSPVGLGPKSINRDGGGGPRLSAD